MQFEHKNKTQKEFDSIVKAKFTIKIPFWEIANKILTLRKTKTLCQYSHRIHNLTPKKKKNKKKIKRSRSNEL